MRGERILIKHPPNSGHHSCSHIVGKRHVTRVGLRCKPLQHIRNQKINKIKYHDWEATWYSYSYSAFNKGILGKVYRTKFAVSPETHRKEAFFVNERVPLRQVPVHILETSAL